MRRAWYRVPGLVKLVIDLCRDMQPQGDTPRPGFACESHLVLDLVKVVVFEPSIELLEELLFMIFEMI